MSEYSAIQQDAVDGKRKAHFGEVLELCGEKGSELPEGLPLRRFRGRIVLRGYEVRDEHNDYTISLNCLRRPQPWGQAPAVVGRR